MSPRARRAILIAGLLGAVLLTLAALRFSRSGVVPTQTQVRAVDYRPSGPGSPESMPVGNLPGWREVFSDDFDGQTLNRSKWRLYWGMPGGDPAGWYDPRHVTVSRGMLVISAYRDPRDGNRWATGGLSSSVGLAQTYGKYLVRFRLDPGIGVGHAVLLMPANNTWPPEIDFSEDNGSGRLGTLATLHYGKNDTHWSAYLPNVNLTQWHTLGVQWTPGRLEYTIDGRIWATMWGNVVPKQPMVLDLQTETWPCTGTWGRCPTAQTPHVVNMYVDWVVAYAYAPDPPR
jgi:beta-glucanase (GH16 family)